MTERNPEGQPLPFDTLLESMSEAILANVIALESAGIPRKDVKMVVGPNGGMVVGEGMVFDTPVTARMSDENGRRLFDRVGQLLSAYEQGAIPEERIAAIRARHNVDHKLQAIRRARSR